MIEKVGRKGNLPTLLEELEPLCGEQYKGSLKEKKASAYNVGDLDSIPGYGRSPGAGNGNPLHTLAWKIPWTEELGTVQSMGSQRMGHD